MKQIRIKRRTFAAVKIWGAEKSRLRSYPLTDSVMRIRDLIPHDSLFTTTSL